MIPMKILPKDLQCSANEYSMSQQTIVLSFLYKRIYDTYRWMDQVVTLTGKRSREIYRK